MVFLSVFVSNCGSCGCVVYFFFGELSFSKNSMLGWVGTRRKKIGDREEFTR